MATNYDIDYNDERFQQVEADKQQSLNEIDKTYGDMIGKADAYYDKQIEASKQWEEKQTQLQQEQTDFAIDKIEQQKEQAKKDYTKEQSGAYIDWQKQSNQYGAKAEQTAANGLTNTGFSESSQVSMYNTYQNRVVAARESYNQAVLSYNNAIKEAQLQNNSILAEIAFEALQQQLSLSLQGFQYKNQLLLEKADKKTEANDRYYARYQDVLAQINRENEFAEQIRQADRAYDLQQQELQLAKDKFAYEKQQDAIAAEIEAKREAQITKNPVKEVASKAASSVKKAVDTIKGALPKNNSVEKSIEAMIAAGATKDNISNEIALAERNGVITKEEAKKLRDKFTPRGIQY